MSERQSTPIFYDLPVENEAFVVNILLSDDIRLPDRGLDDQHSPCENTLHKSNSPDFAFSTRRIRQLRALWHVVGEFAPQMKPKSDRSPT